MNPAIKRYLDEHGATYTPEALRKGLLDAGYDAAEVDAALADWHAAEVSVRGSEARRTFGRWALWLHIGALLAVFVLVVALKGTTAIGTALLGCAVLGVALVIGWAISSLIGRALLGSGGVVVALIVPLISALLLGGACFGLLSSAIGTPPRQGTVELEIAAPRAFQGSGQASCYVATGLNGVEVNSQPLGTLDGKQVSVSLSWYGRGSGVAPQPDGSVNIGLDVTSPSDQPESFGTIFSTTLDSDVAADALTGTIRFQGLALEPGAPATSVTTPETISGTVSWDCR
jgi:hypothetical protein